MKKLRPAIYIVIVIIAMMVIMGASRVAYADRYSPPGESIQDTPTQAEIDAAEQAERERAAAERAAREAAARRARERAEAEARRREEARMAEAARLAAEEARLAEIEESKRRTVRTGMDYVTQGRYQMAINVLRGHVSNTDPYSADAWYWLSRAHHALGDYDRAQAAANIALEIDPYYGPLTKTPSGLEPTPPMTSSQRREPRPSMSVLPVKPLLPSDLALEPVTRSFPYLAGGTSGDAPDGEGSSHAAAGRAGGGAYLRYEPYSPMPPVRTPGWMAVSERFAEIGRWRIRVDRMGILTEPRVPVAWRGATPYEVYFWTGIEWARIPRRSEGESFSDILKGRRYDILTVIRREGIEWDENDTPALAAAASLMRYLWLGDIDLSSADE